MIKTLDIYKQDKPLHKKILFKIKKLFKNNDFINGSEVKNFEKKFSHFCGAKFCSSVGNGTDALLIALKSLDLKKSDEVILPAMTYKSTLLAVTNLGYKPVLVDIDHDTSSLSLNHLEKKINKKTKVIICVSLYGNPVNFKRIKELIKKRDNKIYLIEDSAQSHGAYDCSSCKFKDYKICCQKSKKVGSIGDIACFSFYPGKNLGAYGDAGAIVTNSKKLFNKIEVLKNLGSLDKFNCHISGTNSRLDTIQAIILLEKLKKLEIQNEKRKKNAKLYSKLIINKKIKKLSYYPGSVFHQYVVLTKKRSDLMKLLTNNNVEFGLHYPKAINQLDYVKDFFKKEKFPNAEKLAREGLSLPIHPQLRLKDIKKISQIINSF